MIHDGYNYKGMIDLLQDGYMYPHEHLEVFVSIDLYDEPDYVLRVHRYGKRVMVIAEGAQKMLRFSTVEEAKREFARLKAYANPVGVSKRLGFFAPFGDRETVRVTEGDQ